MNHKFHIQSALYGLRPVCKEDAPFILTLRTDAELNRYLHPTSPSIEDQLQWLENYFKRDNDFYFVIEELTQKTPQGLISLYDVDNGTRSGEWGRWLLLQDSLAAVESALLIYRFGFETLKLHEIYCRTVSENGSVVSFHDSCGIPRRRALPGHFFFDDEHKDAIEHRLSRSEWPVVEDKLQKLSMRIAKRVRHA